MSTNKVSMKVACRAILWGAMGPAFAVGSVAMVAGCGVSRQVHEQTPALRASDVAMLTGGAWKGTLTYLDYTSKKPTEIRSTLVVVPVAGEALAWEMRVGYDDEPQADSGEVAKLEEGGTMFRGERVLEREDKGGRVRIVTETRGDDDHKPATFRFVYEIGAKACSIQKLVKFDEGGEFFERHIYRWTR